jgi:hypothetical protein
MHLVLDLVTWNFLVSHNKDWWHVDILMFLELNHLANKSNLDHGFQFLMWDVYITACFLPFSTSFAQLFCPCNCLLQGKLYGLQTNLMKSLTNICIITSILSCFAKNMANTIYLPRNCKCQRNKFYHKGENSCKGA